MSLNFIDGNFFEEVIAWFYGEKNQQTSIQSESKYFIILSVSYMFVKNIFKRKIVFYY